MTRQRDMTEKTSTHPPKRPKRGRPEKPDGEGRLLSLPPVRVNAAESTIIEERAARAGLSVSAYIRNAALGAELASPPREIDDRLLFELNRSGVNLHQVARHLNFGGAPPNDLSEVLAKLKSAIARVSAAYDP